MEYCNPTYAKNDIIVYDYINKKEIKDNNIYIDDNLDIIIKKINLYCTELKTDSDYIYCWFENKNKDMFPLNFEYIDDDVKINNPFILLETNDIIDELFIKEKIINKEIVFFNNLILETRIDINEINKINFIHLSDLLSLYNINSPSNTKYNKNNWPININITEFYEGFIKKYWPNLTIKNITNHSIIKSYDKFKEIIEDSVDKINFINNYYNKNEIIDCKDISIDFLKIGLYSDIENKANILELYNDTLLNDNIPFTKLILSDYRESYYKLYRHAINKQIKKYLIEFWIKDFKQNEEFGFNNYFSSTNVFILKLYITENKIKYYCSLLIYKNGKIEVIFDRTRLKNKENNNYEYTNEIFTNNIIKKLIDKCNEYILKHSEYFEVDPLQLDYDFLINNYGKTKVELLNVKLNIERFSWNKNSISTLLENMYVYNRKIEEKYYYNIKSGNVMYLRYKRVNNYNNEETIDSIISTLSNPNLKFKPDDIIESIKKNFDLSLDEAKEKYDNWLLNAELKMNDNKKYYSLRSYSEPGIEVNIIQSVGGTNTVIELNSISNFSELNRILIYVKTIFTIYIEYLKNKGLFKELFSKKKKNKKLFETLEEKNKVDINYDDIFMGIDDTIVDIEGDGEIVLENFLAGDIDISNLDVDGEEGIEEFIDPFAGGAKDKIDITRYTMRRLDNSTYDPNLFKFKALQKQPSGAEKTYTKICTSTSRRQPIVLNKEEFDYINSKEAEELGSGKKSYSNYMKVGSNESKEFYYICPKYWDVSRNISLDPKKKSEWEKENKVIPSEINKGFVEETVYDKKSKDPYWRKAGEDVEDYIVKPLPDGYRKEDVDMPCCFRPNDKKFKEGVKKETKNKFIIAYKIPSPTDSIGYINEEINKYIDQNNNIYLGYDKILDNMRNINKILTEYTKNNTTNKTKEKQINSKINYIINKDAFNNIGLKDLKIYGFVKKGISKNINNSLFYSICEVLDISIEKFKKDLLLKSNIHMYQCTNLYNIYKKEIKDINLNDIKYFYEYILINKLHNNEEYFKSILKNNYYIVSGEKIHVKNIHDLYYYFINYTEFGQQYIYLLNLIISYNNYLRYIKDDNVFKYDDYFLNIIENIYDMNLIIFEDIHNTIKIKSPPANINDRNKYIFIIKKGNFYEPIIYKIEKKSNSNFYNKYEEILNKEDIQILNNFKDLNNEFYIKIFNINEIDNNIKKDCLSFLNNTIKNINKKYFKIIKNKTINEYNLNDLLKSSNINIKKIVIDSHNNISHLIDIKNYIIPIKPISTQYIQTFDKKSASTNIIYKNIHESNYDILYTLNDITYINGNDDIKNYTYILKSCKNILNNTNITGIIIENSYIVNLLVNSNYIPIKPTKLGNKSKKKLEKIKGNTDIRKIDKDLQLNNIIENDSLIFNKYYDYEKKINNIFNKIIIRYLKKNENDGLNMLFLDYEALDTEKIVQIYSIIYDI